MCYYDVQGTFKCVFANSNAAVEHFVDEDATVPPGCKDCNFDPNTGQLINCRCKYDLGVRHPSFDYADCIAQPGIVALGDDNRLYCDTLSVQFPELRDQYYDFEAAKNYYRQITNVSETACANECKMDSRCLGFGYDNMGNKCFLSNRLDILKSGKGPNVTVVNRVRDSLKMDNIVVVNVDYAKRTFQVPLSFMQQDVMNPKRVQTFQQLIMSCNYFTSSMDNVTRYTIDEKMSNLKTSTFRVGQNIPEGVFIDGVHSFTFYLEPNASNYRGKSQNVNGSFKAQEKIKRTKEGHKPRQPDKRRD